MTTTQLDLFGGGAPLAPRPVTLVTVCCRCGVPLSATTLPDAAQPWQEAVLWGYVAQATHECAKVDA